MLFSVEEELFGQGAAQLCALEHVVQSGKDVGKPPNDMTCSGAFEMLRAAGGYTDSEPEVGALFVRSREDLNPRTRLETL